LIGWLLDTNVTAEIISAGGSASVKVWAAGQEEATLHLSILTIAEYDKGIANLADGDPRRPVYMTTRNSLAARFAARLLPVSDAIVRRWGTISGTVRRDTGHPPPVIYTLLAAIALDQTSIWPPETCATCATAAPSSSTRGRDDPSAFPVIPRQKRRRAPHA
jgi:predicted nucleic acid-binding protein